MIIRLAAVLITSALVAGCGTLTPGGGIVKACRENLISNLNDPESYREDSKPKEIQAEPDQPKVWSWYFNAKNTMGGYGEGKELLCYQEDSGRIIQETFGSDEPEARRNFLALTSPKIRDQIAKEEAEAERKRSEAKAKREAETAAAAAEAERKRAEAKAKRETETAAKAAETRRIYNRNYSELSSFCRAKSRPDGLRGRYGGLSNFDLSSYNIRGKALVQFDLKNGSCNKLNENYIYYKGKEPFTPEAVGTWGSIRSAVCKVEPQFCER